MAPSNGHANTTETSPLLAKDASIPATTSLGVSSNGAAKPNGVKPAGGQPSTDRAADEESGEVEEPNNPIYDGMPDVTAKLYVLAPALAIGIFLAAADQTIIVSTASKIGSEMNALNSTSWIATAYFLTLTTVQPLCGKLSDIFGRKPTLLFSYAVFGLGCLFCGVARNMGELIAARAFAGIGGGGMTTVTSIMFSDIIPLRQRGTWQGYLNIIFATGASIGAPLGGVFADSIGWRWLFLGQVPMCLAAFAAVYFALKLPKIEEFNWKEKLSRIDFLGAFFLVIATSTLLFGLDRGSNVSWNSTLAIACLSISIPLFAVFLFVEMKWAANPFAPGHIIFERSLSASFLCNFFTMGAYMIIIFYIPLFLQAVDGLSAFEAGIRLIPGIIGGVSGSLTGGIIIQKTGKYYWLTVTGYSLFICGSILVLLFSGLVVNWTPAIITGHILSGFGGGIGITTTLISLIANADPKDQAIATACSYLFRSLGTVVNLSVAATVVQQLLRMQLRDRLKNGDQADKIVDRVRQSLDYINTLDPETRDIVRLCYQNATNAAFMVALVTGVLALISSFYIREKKLSK